MPSQHRKPLSPAFWPLYLIAQLFTALGLVLLAGLLALFDD